MGSYGAASFLRVYEYPDGTLAIFPWQRCVARYRADRNVTGQRAGPASKMRPTDVLRKAIKVTSRLRGLAVTGKQGDGVNDPQSSIEQLCFADEDT
jgi:hypothetical protein